MGRKKQRPLSLSEKRFIDENPFNMNDHQIARCLNRYVEQVRMYKRRSSAKAMPRWTDEDVKVLREMTGKYSDEAIGEVLGRTASAVWGKKQRLGLLSGKAGRPRKKRQESKKFDLTTFVRGVLKQHSSTWT